MEPSNVCFNKPSRWFWCLLTFKNHCKRAIFFQLFLTENYRKKCILHSGAHVYHVCTCTRAHTHTHTAKPKAFRSSQNPYSTECSLIFSILFCFIRKIACCDLLTVTSSLKNCPRETLVHMQQEICTMIVAEWSVIAKRKKNIFRRMDKWIIAYFYNVILHSSLYY